MRTRRELVSKRQCSPCKYCGAPIVWRQWAKGGWCPADVQQARGGGLEIVTGAGNHYNLKPRHDCRSHARLTAKGLQERISEYQAKLDAAIEGLKHEHELEGVVMTPFQKEMSDSIIAHLKAIVQVMPNEIKVLTEQMHKHLELANKI